MNPFMQLLLGLVAMTVLGFAVKPLVKHVQKAEPLLPPNDAVKDKWEKLVAGDEGGALMGPLERVLFFGAFWMNQPLVVAAWLAFKVASKWNAWTNIIAVPNSLEEIDDLDYLIARRRWGSQLLTTFLVGTLANVLVGFVAVAIGRHGGEAGSSIYRLISG